MTKPEKNLIGIVKQFKGYFDLFRTDNIFRFLKPIEIKRIKSQRNLDSTILGKLYPRVKINSIGTIVEILNKKEGLFVCEEYSSSIFKFFLKTL